MAAWWRRWRKCWRASASPCRPRRCLSPSTCRGNRMAVSVFTCRVLGSWTGELGAALVDTVLTQDRTRGWGAVNRGRYSNPQLDALVDSAVHTLDAPARERMLVQANEIVAHELPFVLLYQEMNIWAARRGLKY